MARHALSSGRTRRRAIAAGLHGQLAGDPRGAAPRRRSIFRNSNGPGEHTCQVFKSSAGEGSDSARLMLLVSIAAARRIDPHRQRLFHSGRPLPAHARRSAAARRAGGNHHAGPGHRCADGARGGQDALEAAARSRRALLRISARAVSLQVSARGRLLGLRRLRQSGQSFPLPERRGEFERAR